MTIPKSSDRLERPAERNEHQSWADIGSVAPEHPLLSRYISSYTYSIGFLRDHDVKLITRAYPTVMTQIFFEFSGGLSEIRGQGHGFGKVSNTRSRTAVSGNQATDNFPIEKRTYIKQGLGRWFDIYQLASEKQSRPIKNLKVDLYPIAFYELFQCAPAELVSEDLQLADLLGHTSTGLMLEEMEAANGGKELIRIVERYFLQHLRQQISSQRLEVHASQTSNRGKQYTTKPKGFIPPLPEVHETLSQQAQRYNKSDRWLQKRYAEVYGMSFKQIQSNLKFHSTHLELWQAMARRQPLSLTDLAHRSGYFDQAHFIKDFKRYTGMTPGQYLRTNFDEQSQYLWYW